MTTLLCPSCYRPDDLSTVEQLTAATSVKVTRGADGTVKKDYDASERTNVDWDSSKTVGIQCGDGCDFRHLGADWADKLIPVPTLEQFLVAAVESTDYTFDNLDEFIKAAGAIDANDPRLTAPLTRILASIMQTELGADNLARIVEGPTLEDLLYTVDERRSDIENGVLADPTSTH